MPLNSYFLQGSQGEQRLVQDLINEQLKIYGQDIIYLPRKLVSQDAILNETIATEFDDSFRMEAYLANYDGFAGNGDILSKFGVQSTDQITLIISKERYEDFTAPFLVGEDVIVSSRPAEGDLIYLPLDNTIFEIKYVEAKKPFYQLNKLFVYQLSCEVFDAALDELVDTGIEEVDQAVSDFIFTTKLTMIGLGAQQATSTVQLAKDTGGGLGDFAVSRVDLVNDGTGYTVPPIIGITTAPAGGINATAVALMTQRTGQVGQSIDSIQITNPGIGYTITPTIIIRSQNTSGTGGIATAIITEGAIGIPNITFAGVGYGVTPTVAITTAPSGGTNATAVAILNVNDTLNSIRYTNAGAGYTLAPTITVELPASGINTDNYLYGELVRGVSTGTTAYVHKWDADSNVLQITNASSNFAIGEIIVGIGTSNLGSDAARRVSAISDQDEFDEFADNIEIESEADTILDFTERNPFGEI